MGLLGGGFLRLMQTAFYFLALCCAAIILGIYSYFLASLTHNNQHIPTWEKAVEGLSGAATLYCCFAVLLTCFLAGVTFFSFIALFLDLCMVGAFVAIAILTRRGTTSCTAAYVRSPLGNGPPHSRSAGGRGTHLDNACRLNKAAFAVSIIGLVLFLITALMQIALQRHHKKENRYGPSPANNYTSGSGKRMFWNRRRDNDVARDVEIAPVAATSGLAAPAAAHTHGDVRPSHETGYTGSTVAPGAGLQKDEAAPIGTAHGGYYTAPHTTANPYTTTGTAANY